MINNLLAKQPVWQSGIMKWGKESKLELKGFRDAIETLGYTMNVSTTYGQISKIEIGFENTVEGQFIDIDEPSEF